MPRVKRGSQTPRKRRALLKQTKGYGWSRKSKKRPAREALLKAWSYSYRDRKVRKRDFRRLWQTKINAAARENATTYSQLVHLLTQKKIGLNRKMLADLAENEPAVFKRVLREAGLVKSSLSES